MKTIRNSARLLALILVLTFVLLPFVGCKKKEQNVNGYCTVVVATDPVKEYKVDLDKVTIDNGLISIFEYLKANEGFTYEMQESTYGAFLTKVLTLDSTAVENSFITLMTSVEKDFDVSEYAVEKNYNGTKLVSSGLGASSMTIEAGAVYYIALSSY